MSVIFLPIYPSLRTRKALPPSQLATLNQLVSSVLLQCLSAPLARYDLASLVAFLSSYSRDAATRSLQDLIWSQDRADLSSVDKTIRHRVLLLAERISASLDFQVLLDFSVAFGRANPKMIRRMFGAAFSQNTSRLTSQLCSEVIPAFTALLGSTDQGLYGIRKTSFIILACLQSSPTEGKRIFARDKTFVLALATAYDGGLSAVTQLYGGLRLSDASDREADEWERILLEAKVALMDAFHILLRVLFDDVAAITNAGSTLAAQCEPAFEVVFSLLELPQTQSLSSGSAALTPPTPFLNQPLLADYQHAYDLAHTVVSVLRKADDARTEILESALKALDSASTGSDPGALKLILRSSGVPPGVDHKGKCSPSLNKGKAKAAAVPTENDPALDGAVAQVLDVLPDQPSLYVRYLLAHSDYPFQGSAERLIEAIFEGTAPSLADVESSMRTTKGLQEYSQPEPAQEEYQYTKDRLNVFDGVSMEPTLLRIGKKNDNSGTIQDRAYIEQIKAKILRLAEEASYEDDDDDGEERKADGRNIAFEDDLRDDSGIRVRDGEVGEEDDKDNETDGNDDIPVATAAPQTTLELAYIRDPKLFDRDAQTRRSTSRAELKNQTGWTDEQIEGWKIMLDRDPNKNKILQRHEFTGNKSLSPAEMQAERSLQSLTPGRGRGGGRGRGRGRGGRGRGGSRGGGSSGDGGGERERPWNDRHKASRGNHNRKAGHDKKMARGGGPI